MAVLALAAADVASAQAPHDLYQCLTAQGPDCAGAGGRLVDPDCGGFFENWYGVVAWFPLQCVGPIVIEVENIALWDTRFPLYVEVVPLSPNPSVCFTDRGFLVFVVHGIATLCGGWEASSPIDITPAVPLGSLYALRLRFFASPVGFSPAVDCVRVTAQTVESTVEPQGWGPIKKMYR
jgi:hypothetical protein